MIRTHDKIPIEEMSLHTLSSNSSLDFPVYRNTDKGPKLGAVAVRSSSTHLVGRRLGVPARQ